MHRKAKQVVKDSTGVGLLVSSAGLFVLRACRHQGALPRAGRHAVSAAAVAAPVAGAIAFIGSKSSNDKWVRDEALEETAKFGGFAGVAAGALGGFISLAWDAFRGQ